MEITNSSGWYGELEISIEFEDNGIKYRTVFDRKTRTASVEKQDKTFSERKTQPCPTDNFGRELSDNVKEIHKLQSNIPNEIA